MMKEKRTGISRAEAEGRMGIKGKRNTGGKKFGPAVRKPPGSTDGIGLIAALPRETDIFVWFQSFGFPSSYFEVFPIDFRSGPFDQAKRVARWAKKSLFISTLNFFFRFLPCRASSRVWGAPLWDQRQYRHYSSAR